jgi:glycosyltransferase involved in cell wall biosynthesis
MEKIKVCQMTSSHSAHDIRIFLKECKSLVMSGYKVVLLAPNEKDENIDNVEIRAIPKINNIFMRMITSSWSVYRLAIKENASLYHFHDPELLPCGLLLKWRGKKVIYDAHEDVPQDIMMKDWIPLYVRKIMSILFKIFEDNMVKQFDVIAAATPYITKRFQELGCKAVNLNNYPFGDELIKVNSNNIRDKTVCFVGGIDKNRGIVEMIQAIGLTSGKLYLVGTFSTKNLRDYVMTLAGWKQVVELGQCQRSQVADILSISSAGLVLFKPGANHNNAQPNKMFEYMSAGIPVIASNFPLWREIVEGNRCGICVNPLSIDEISQAIRWVFDHPDEAAEMGENGRRAIRSKYNWEHEQNVLVELYRSLLPEVI